MILQKEKADKHRLVCLLAFLFPMHNLFSIYTKGIDLCLPLLKVVQVAYFNNDKYKGFVNKNDAIFLKLLRGNSTTGSIMAKNAVSTQMLKMENINSGKKFVVNYENGLPHVKVILNIERIITETFESKSMSNREMEKLFENKIKSTSKRLITRFQNENCDPVGIG
jgi:spore germination protein